MLKSRSQSWRGAVLAVILTVTLFKPPPAPAEFQRSTEIELERFFESDYTWCDVELLSAYWGQDVVEAKARIGRKIGWGDQLYIEEFLGSARDLAIERGQKCDYHESGFTYDDAKLLSAVWGTSIGETKALVENKLFWGDSKLVYDALSEARGGIAPQQQENPIDAYWAKGFTFCDARLVAALWNEDIGETKYQLGSKILAGYPEGVESNLEQARREVRGGGLRGFQCNYWDEGYQYEDMVALAGFWRMTVEDTKATVEQKLFWGQNDLVQEALGRAR